MTKNFSKFGEQLKGDLYQEEAIFNMTALYYTIIADVLRATFNASVNKLTDMFISSVRDLLSIAVPVYEKRDEMYKFENLRKKLDQAEKQHAAISRAAPQKRQFMENNILKEVTNVRLEVIKILAPILIATQMKLLPEGKLREALGVGLHESVED